MVAIQENNIYHDFDNEEIHNIIVEDDVIDNEEIQIPEWIVGDLQEHWDKQFFSKVLQYGYVTGMNKILNNEIQHNSGIDNLMYASEFSINCGYHYHSGDIKINHLKNTWKTKLLYAIQNFPYYSESFTNVLNMIEN